MASENAFDFAMKDYRATIRLEPTSAGGATMSMTHLAATQSRRPGRPKPTDAELICLGGPGLAGLRPWLQFHGILK